MNKKIVPAILEKTQVAIRSKLRRVSGLVGMVQVDICDGRFVSSTTYASTGRSSSVVRIVSMAHKEGLEVELDLMVDLDCGDCMQRWVDALKEAKPERVIFHLGSTYRWEELFSRLHSIKRERALPFSVGLAVRVDHTRREISKVLSEYEFSFIQVMGIAHVGTSGEVLTPEVYDRIKKIKRAFPDTTLSVDGGVKLENAQGLFAAGAEQLGVNSGLFGATNIQSALKEFMGK